MLDKQINLLILQLKSNYNEFIWDNLIQLLDNYLNKKIHKFYIINNFTEHQIEKEDLYQQCLIKLYQCFQQYNSNKNNNFFAWYCNCLDKLFINIKRDIDRRNKYKILNLEKEINEDGDKLSDIIPVEQDMINLLEINNFKSKLNKNELKYFYGMFVYGNQQETAKKLGIGQSTLSRNLKNIKKKYEVYSA
jgi:RNA polymerase sigma factor (sigma-70 family)